MFLVWKDMFENGKKTQSFVRVQQRRQPFVIIERYRTSQEGYDE